MPHTLRAIDGEDETIAELEMTVGFDDDLAGATEESKQLERADLRRGTADGL